MSAQGKTVEPTDAGADAGKTVDTGKAADIGKAAPELTNASILDGALPEAGKEAPDGKAADTKTSPWGDDWRDRAANGNDKVGAMLKRFTSPETMATALFAARQKLSEAGKPASALPENATPEQVAEYRKAAGIPEKADGYIDPKTLPAGLVIGEADKPLVGKFTEKMHTLNAAPAVVHGALQAYYEVQAEQVDQANQRNTQARQETMDALATEFGAKEARQNLGALKGWTETLPEAVRDDLFNARDGNGIQLMNKPEVVKYFIQHALDANPAATVVPGHGANAGTALTTEIESIKSTMANEPEKYWKDAKMQARYRELLDARDRMKK